MDIDNPPSPGVKCPYCNAYDWTFNKTFKQWECTSCGANKSKVNISINLSDWYIGVAERFTDHEKALKDLELEPEPDTDVARIMKLARLGIAQKNLDETVPLTEVAMLIKGLSEYSKEGEIHLTLPDIKLDVKLKW